MGVVLKDAEAEGVHLDKVLRRMGAARTTNLVVLDAAAPAESAKLFPGVTVGGLRPDLSLAALDDDGSEGGIHPRWGKVYAVGDQQEDVKVGEWVMVSHGRWSRGFKVKKNGVELEVRMIDENDILLVSDEEPDFNSRQAGYINTGGAQQMTKLPGND